MIEVVGDVSGAVPPEYAALFPEPVRLRVRADGRRRPRRSA